MSYKNAHHILPQQLLSAVQEYIDGEYLYIPRLEAKKKPWGAGTDTRERLKIRNSEILAKYKAGISVANLADEFFLSEKAVYKIIRAAQSG